MKRMTRCDPREESSRCRRCGGLTVVDDLCGGTEGTPEWELSARRCVICGDVVDPVILEHQTGISGGSQERTLKSGPSTSQSHKDVRGGGDEWISY